MAKNGFSGLLQGTGGWRPNMPMVLNGISMMSGAGPMPGMGLAAVRTAENQRDRQQYAQMLQQPGVLEGLTPQQQAVVRNLSPRAGMSMIAQLQSRRPQAAAGSVYGKQGTIVQGADGKYYTVQFGSDGSRRIEPLGIDGTNMTPSRGVSRVDTGTGTEIIDRATGQPVRTVDKNLVEAERLKGEGRALGKNAAEIPQKYENLEQKKQQSSLVATTIDDAIKQADAYTTGPAGWALSNVPGTAAYSLSQKLATIKANLGFDKLQAMRDASPTGGALGQVSEMENRLLQSVWGSVEQAQNPKELRTNLARVKKIQAESIRRLEIAYQRDLKAIQEGRLPMPPGGLPRPSQMLSNNTNSGGGWSIKRVK